MKSLKSNSLSSEIWKRKSKLRIMCYVKRRLKLKTTCTTLIKSKRSKKLLNKPKMNFSKQMIDLTNNTEKESKFKFKYRRTNKLLMMEKKRIWKSSKGFSLKIKLIGIPVTLKKWKWQDNLSKISRQILKVIKTTKKLKTSIK